MLDKFISVCKNCGYILYSDKRKTLCPICWKPIDTEVELQSSETEKVPEVPVLQGIPSIISYCNRRISALVAHRNDLKKLYKDAHISESSCEKGLAADAAAITELQSLVSLMGGKSDDLTIQIRIVIYNNINNPRGEI